MISQEYLTDINGYILGKAVAKPTLGSVLSSYHYYDTVEEQIMSIVYGIIKNHPFVDANKRTATVVLFYLSERNNLNIANDGVVFDVIVGMAAGNYDQTEAIEKLFR